MFHQNHQPQTLPQRRHRRAAATLKPWKHRLTCPCHPARSHQRERHKETEKWRWLQRGKQKKRKLYVFFTAPSARWLSTLPRSCRPTTVVRNWMWVVKLNLLIPCFIFWSDFISAQALSTRQCWRRGAVMEPSSPSQGRGSRPSRPRRLSCRQDSRTKLSIVRSAMCTSTPRLSLNKLVAENAWDTETAHYRAKFRPL